MLWKNILYYYCIVIWCRGKEGKGNNWLPSPNPTIILNLNPSFWLLTHHLSKIVCTGRLNRTENEMLQCCLCTAIGAAHICRVYLGAASTTPPPPAPRCSLPLPPSVAPAVSPIVAQTPIFLPFRSISLVLAATVQQCLPSKCCVIMFKVWACRRCRLWAAQAAVGSPVQLIIERQLLTKHQQNLNIISQISAIYYQNTHFLR